MATKHIFDYVDGNPTIIEPSAPKEAVMMSVVALALFTPYLSYLGLLPLGLKSEIGLVGTAVLGVIGLGVFYFALLCLRKTTTVFDCSKRMVFIHARGIVGSHGTEIAFDDVKQLEIRPHGDWEEDGAKVSLDLHHADDTEYLLEAMPVGAPDQKEKFERFIKDTGFKIYRDPDLWEDYQDLGLQ